MTGQPLRFALPIRTSKRKAEAKSPQQQIDLATSWAKTHHHEIAAVLDSGRSESGKTMDRETIHQAMQMVRDGQADGIVFAITDRLGRAPIEEAMAWIRELNVIGYLGLADAGGEPVRLMGQDPSRETMLVIQLQFARQYWLATAARFRQSQRDAVKVGKWIGRAPLGYVTDDAGRLCPDPVQGEVVAQAYRFAARDGLHAAVSHLQARVPEREWTTDHARRLLRSRAYLGEYRYQLKDDPGNFTAETLVGPDHVALIDLKTWEAAQTDPHTRRSNGHYPLTHRVHCGRCHWGLVGALQTVRKDGKSYRRMRCSNTACNGGCSVGADKLEVHIREEVKALVADRQFRDTFSPDGLADAEAELRSAKAERSALTAKVRPSHPDFSEWLADADAAVADAQRRFTALAARAEQSEALPGPDQLDKPEQFARALRVITSRFRIVVASGRGTMTERVDFQPLDHDHVAGPLAA